MKKISTLLLFSLSFFTVIAQEANKTVYIYLSNGTPISGGRLVSANDETIEFSYDNGSKTYQRARVLIAFNESGHYLVVDNISRDTERAKSEIIDFYNSQTAPLANDIIFKAVPFEIIPCSISYNKDAVNYKTLDGNSATINKDNVLAIINRNGSHEIIKDIAEVAPILGSNLDKFKQAVTTTTPAKPEPKPEPAPLVVTPPQPVVPDTKPLPVIDISAKPKLTDDEKKEYSNQSTDNILTFKDYLNRIGDKRRSPSEKRQDIVDALELFSPGATIEVTSKNKPGSRKIPVEKYLNNLSNLNYSSVQIEYANLRFVSELNQAPDGNYYGIVRGEQTFKGMDANGKPTYWDVVDKNYKIKVESYNNIVSGKKEVKWKVLLGDVSVSQ